MRWIFLGSFIKFLWTVLELYKDWSGGGEISRHLEMFLLLFILKNWEKKIPIWKCILFDMSGRGRTQTLEKQAQCWFLNIGLMRCKLPLHVWAELLCSPAKILLRKQAVFLGGPPRGWGCEALYSPQASKAALLSSASHSPAADFWNSLDQKICQCSCSRRPGKPS